MKLQNSAIRASLSAGDAMARIGTAPNSLKVADGIRYDLSVTAAEVGAIREFHLSVAGGLVEVGGLLRYHRRGVYLSKSFGSSAS